MSKPVELDGHNPQHLLTAYAKMWAEDSSGFPLWTELVHHLESHYPDSSKLLVQEEVLSWYSRNLLLAVRRDNSIVKELN